MADGGGLNVEIGVTLDRLTKQLAAAEQRMIRAAKKSEDAFAASNKRVAESFGLIAGGARKAEASLQGFGKGAFDQLGQSVTTLQQRINSVTGINPAVAQSARDSAAAFDAFDQSKASVDALRASIDPLFAASQRYERALQTLDAAQEQGVISARQYAALNDQLAASYLRAGNVAGTFGGRLGGLGLQSQAARQGLQQIGFQVQDFAVQVGAGTSATQAFAQQFPQLASAFGPAGVAIGTLAAVLVPLGAAFFSAQEGADALNESLREQETLSNSLIALAEDLRLAREQEASGAETKEEQKALNEINALLEERAAITSQINDLDAQDLEGTSLQIAAKRGALAEERQILNVRIQTLQAQLEQIKKERELTAAQKTSKSLADAYKALQDAIAAADISGPWQRVLGFIETARAKAAEVAAIVQQTQIGGGRGAGPGGPLIGSADLAELQAGGGVIRNMPSGVSVGGGRGGGGGGGGGGVGGSVERSAADEIKELLEQGEKEIEQLELKASLLGKTAEQVTYLTAQSELLNAAKEKGLDLDAEVAGTGETLREQIDAQAQSIANLTAAYEMAQEKAEYFKDITEDLKDGLINSIVEGQSFRGVLEDIAKSLAKAALQAALFGTGPLASLFGGNMVGTGLFSFIPGFASGGYTGDGGRNQPKGVVHGGEYVFSKDATRRIGVRNLDAMHRQLRGFSSGGAVGPASSGPGMSPSVQVVVIDNEEKFGSYLAANPRAEREVMNIVKRNGG